MSFSTWHNYGYGVCMAGLGYKSTKKMESLLEYAPKVKQNIQEWFNQCEISEPTMDDYFDYDQDEYLSVGAILRDVIAEAEGIELLACNDYDGHIYLLYPPVYPWHASENDLQMTEEKIEAVIRKYLSIIAEKDFDVEYLSAENGG